MKTNEDSHLDGEKNTNNLSEKREYELDKGKTKSNPTLLPKDQQLQKSVFYVAGDEDFQKIFPHLKSAEKRYFNKKAKRSFNKSKLTILLIVAILLFIVLCIIFTIIGFN